jgi:hypothetical protein
MLWLCLCAALQTATVQAQFTFVTNNGAISITGYTGASGNMIIPSATNGYPIVNIASSAFNENTIICRREFKRRFLRGFKRRQIQREYFPRISGQLLRGGFGG